MKKKLDIYYGYQGGEDNHFSEAFVKVSFDNLSLAVSTLVDSQWGDSFSDLTYFEGSYTFTLPHDLSLNLHAGYYDLKDAKNLIKKNNVYWNSGMFIFNGSWFLETLKSLEPLAYKHIFKAIESGKNKSKYFYPEKKSFSKISSISFDKAFAEKESNILMATLDAGWSDLGSWLSLSALQKLPSSAMTLYSEGLYERCDKPWGFFEILMETDLSKVKLISVFPHQKLSLQKHKHRTETWYVISGTAKVTKGNERFTMQAGDSVIIDKNQIHRLENITEEPLEVIEIQTGSYFG